MRLAQPSTDLNIGESIGVVDVKHGTFQDRQGQIKRAACIAPEADVQCGELALPCKANCVGDLERMALTSDAHVHVAFDVHSHGTADFDCGYCGNNGWRDSRSRTGRVTPGVS